jgi:hypothetical protein
MKGNTTQKSKYIYWATRTTQKNRGWPRVVFFFWSLYCLSFSLFLLVIVLSVLWCFFFGHCIVCPSIYSVRPLWYCKSPCEHPVLYFGIVSHLVSTLSYTLVLYVTSWAPCPILWYCKSPREHPVLYSVVYIRFTLNQSFSFYCEFGLIVLFVISIRF